MDSGHFAIWYVQALVTGCQHELCIAVRYLPERLPGMGFKRTAREWAKTATLLCDLPYSFVQHQMVGTVVAIFLTNAHVS